MDSTDDLDLLRREKARKNIRTKQIVRLELKSGWSVECPLYRPCRELIESYLERDPSYQFPEVSRSDLQTPHMSFNAQGTGARKSLGPRQRVGDIGRNTSNSQ